MATKKAEPGGVPLTVQRIVDPEAIVRPAHRISFAAVDDNVQLEVGYFDVPMLREHIELAKGGKEPNEPLEFHVIGRYTISEQAAVTLLDTAQRINQYFAMRRGLGVVDERPDDIS